MMGKELDLNGKICVVQDGKARTMQSYINTIDGSIYVRINYYFVPVIKKGTYYIIFDKNLFCNRQSSNRYWVVVKGDVNGHALLLSTGVRT